MKTIRIFIGSPGDVHEEREKVRKVVNTLQLQRQFEGRMLLKLVAWEGMALSAADPFQVGIEKELQTLDISIFVFWWRLGSPLSEIITRRDGTPYRSGTEREFDVMLERAEENRRNQRQGPEILVYFRKDEKRFAEELSRDGLELEEWEEMLQQRRLLKSFYEKNFQDAQGHNTRSYYNFEKPEEFAEQLYQHLHALLDQLDLEGSSIVWQEAPYRGLEVFDVHHAPIFRGREQANRRSSTCTSGCAFAPPRAALSSASLAPAARANRRSPGPVSPPSSCIAPSTKR